MKHHTERYEYLDELYDACLMPRAGGEVDVQLLAIVTKGGKGSLLKCVSSMILVINELMGVSN